MLDFGSYKATVKSTSLRVINDKTVVQVCCVVGEESCDVLIFITEKSLGIARASLKACGFNIDTTDLSALDQFPSPIEGNEVPIYVEDYNGKLRANVELNRKPEPGTLADLTKSLRDVKKKTGDDLPF